MGILPVQQAFPPNFIIFSLATLLSSSSRRTWIEIAAYEDHGGLALMSSSSRRTWIEMHRLLLSAPMAAVVLLAEDVDRNG